MGGLANIDSRHFSSSWQLEYRQKMGEHFMGGFSYINEGHIPNHHRDSGALQVWAQTKTLNNKLSVAAGLGPYYFFDTTSKIPTLPSHNEHGWGGILSLGATYYTDSRWLFHIRSNWIGIGNDMDGISALAGIGYQLDDTAPAKTRSMSSMAEDENKNEVTVLLGQTITNTLNTSQDISTSVEYRRSLTRHIDWTAAWLHEMDDRSFRKNGITTQLWAVQRFFDDNFSLGAGAGGYFALDHFDDLVDGQNTNQLISGIVTLTAAYRFHPNWDMRASWSRIITKYNIDTDVIMGGVGFLF